MDNARRVTNSKVRRSLYWVAGYDIMALDITGNCSCIPYCIGINPLY